MADQDDEQRESPNKCPASIGIFLIILSVGTRSTTSILTPIWLDARKNTTDTSNTTGVCDEKISSTSDPQIDPLSIMCIVNFLFLVFWGLVLLITKILCPYLITDQEKGYSKTDFALIGFADTVSGILFVFASSGCRTAPYLQSLAANFCVPVTFVIRYLMLQKRPTCRKMVCAILVLFAEFTALIPDIVPGLETQRARQDQGGADGIAGVLWPLCFFFGYIPLALTSVVLERAVKTSAPVRNRDTSLNVAYILFWSYLASFLFHILLFWVDIIPGFGMADGIVEFAKGFWFNIQCFFGQAGCRGMITVVSLVCTACLFLNRLVNAYFLRYLEGANYLVIITTIQTPVVFLFFTLFNESPVYWHPHAYLSTWLSVAALCIMIPAIYIYDTGEPEKVPPKSPNRSPVVFTTVTSSCQTDPSGDPSTDDLAPLLTNWTDMGTG
ncbi:uncharacterized protein LOC127871282 isoform X2 [Dreissena polymorpha]|uniref:uncharacterized protein LOC127871282 isoform X2 n=1 Tax=Dreissena polymorpha TaxID=45954 RepID=UPI002263BF8C|nr:uncharacterized protein LOC127871282 isoform X2 [Dreissena polymorpha]